MLEPLMDAYRRMMHKAAQASLKFIEDDGIDDPEHADKQASAVLEDGLDNTFGHIKDFLPHASFIPENKVFTLETSPQVQSPLAPRRVEAMGFTLELSPLCGANQEVAKALRGLITQLPTGASMQWSIMGDPRVHDMIDDYYALREKHPVYEHMAKRRAHWYLKGAYAALFEGTPYRLRKIRLVLSVTIPVSDANDIGKLEHLIALRTTLVGVLTTLQMQPHIWTADDWLDWMEFYANPQSALAQRDFKPRTHDTTRLLREQVFHPGTVMRIRPQHLRFGDSDDNPVALRTLSATEYPQDFRIEQAAMMVGDYLRQDLQYPCPYIVTLGIMALDFNAEKAMATVKSARATTNAESPMARFMPQEFRDKKRDWDNVTESFNRGEGTVHLYHQVVLIDDLKEIDKAERSAESLWRSRSFRLTTDRYMQMQGWQACVPMMLTPSFQKDLRQSQRYVTKTVANAVDTSPIIGEWSGIGKPSLLLWGRLGQFFSIDTFANPQGNYNISMAAGSGAGKSVFGNEMISGVRCQNGIAYVIDAGRSYENACKTHDGQFIEFTPEYTPNFNPFSMIEDLDSDDQAFKDAVVMISQIVNSMSAPDKLLDDYQQGIVEEVVQSEIEQFGRNGSVTGVYERLIAFKNIQTSQPDPVAGQLAQSMRSYTRHGIFAKHFEGGDPIRLDKDFVVLELDGLAASPRLQSTVLMIIMFRITQQMYLTRNVRKIVLIDEAWDLMREGATAKFIEAGYRRARKYNGQFVTITQSFNDYFKTSAAKAAYENSDWKISLRQGEETWEDTFSAKRFVASESQQAVLRSLRTEAGKYSDIFIKGPMGWGVGRLILDPYSQLEYSTKAEDFSAIAHYRAQGMSIPQSIESVLRDRGVQ